MWVRGLGEKTGYKGVSFSKIMKKWIVLIMVNGKSRYLGSFKVKKDAAKVYNEAAEKYHGEFADLDN